MKKKLLSMLTALALLLTLMPSVSFAYYDDETPMYPNATLKYIPVDERTLEIDYENDGSTNFPELGDKVEVSYGSNKDIYTYVQVPQNNDANEGDVQSYTVGFQDENGNWGEIGVEYDGGRGKAWTCAGKSDESGRLLYYVESRLPVKLNTDVKSFTFSPSSLKIDSNKLYKDLYGKYYFTTRSKYDWDYEMRDTAFAPGDKVTVTYKNGNSKTYSYIERYSYDGGTCYNCFINGTECIWLEVDFDDEVLNAGNNTVRLWHKGVSTTISVYLETPAMRAQAEAKEWNGTLNKKIPTVKKPKFKATKKSIKVSWTKATKKNLKKFDKVEIQVCKNKKFKKANTKRVEVKKTKKKATIKKLKKGTYYVRVRNVKGSGVNKQVSKWSKVKKVKVKK